MLITVQMTWRRGGTSNATGYGTGLAFDTATKLIVAQSAQLPLADFQDLPADVHLPAGALLDGECAADYTRTVWYYDGSNGTTTTTEANSVACGWTNPSQPPALSCELGTATLVVGGEPGALTLTAAVSGTAHGPLRYALNGGTEQASPTFAVAPGTHTVRIRDTGLTGCERTVSQLVSDGIPTGAPAGIDFVQQPLWYTAQVPAGSQVLLELYAEHAHGAEDFARVFQARKRADAAGRVAFRLDTLLAPLLRAQVPPLLTADVVVCTAPLVNYFVRTAPLLPSGLPGAFTTGPLRTALRGGLPAEHQARDYFADRLAATGQPPFLSWKPAGQALTPDQPEWLFWLCPPGTPAQLTLRRSYVRTGFASGPPLVESRLVDLSAGRGATNCLLAIPVLPRSGMVTVSVALYDAAGVAVSPLVTYPLVAATPRSRYLQFTNSLGGFDTLRTEGRFEGVLEATADRYELPATPTGGLAERQTFTVTATRKLRLATGWLTAAQLAWLQELVLAREIWEAQPNRLLPVDPTKRTLAYAADENPLRGLLLEYDYAFAVTAYANLPDSSS